jgi:hypothetical protein
MRSRPITLLLALGLLGCADRLRPDDDPPPPPSSSGAFTHDVGADGVTTTVVDATDREVWRHLDLDTGLQVEAEGGWDLSFLRFRVRTNGGLSGDGGVFVARVEGAFEEVTQAPDGGWSTDGPDGQVDDDDAPDNLFNNGEDDWYDYELETHTLTARDYVYAVVTTERRYFKLQFLDYYDEVGSPAYVRFRWAEIEAPDDPMLPDAPDPEPNPDPDPEPDPGPTVPDDAVQIDAGDGAQWVYFSVASGVVSPATPEESLEWDLAFRRTEIRTNSGTSGPGLGGARIDEAMRAHDEIVDASTFGFTVDEIIDSARPGAEPTSLNPGMFSWYDYNPRFHSLTPKEQSFLIRTADGGYASLRIWDWDDGLFYVSADVIARRVEVREVEVDASTDGAWAYLSLREGAVVETAPAEPASDPSWDVALSGTTLRTNGGASGSGAGEAVEVDVASLSALTTLPADGWVADAASGGDSGNAALSSWVDRAAADPPAAADPSPRPVAFGVRTADGDLAALRVVSYAAGVYRLEIAFAGPGYETFQ